ncbi:TPA: hypothetical protein HA278_00795 [Candidatus Woesearchaeota archaeon]|nr:hypothetical protein [Candidatus Woesearchaeota archaeon]
MKRRMLNEVTNEQILAAAIQKSFSQERMTLDEIEALMKLDVGKLIIEHDLSYPEAEHVMYWLKNETSRMNAQSLYQSIEGWDSKGVRPGSPGIIESHKLSSSQLRRLILKEAQKI